MPDVVVVNIDANKCFRIREELTRCNEKITAATGRLDDRFWPNTFLCQKSADLPSQRQRCLEVTKFSTTVVNHVLQL
jgi:hypothetical protein